MNIWPSLNSLIILFRNLKMSHLSKRQSLTKLPGKCFSFWSYGHVIAKNAQQVPETSSILNRISGLQTAFFSVFKPGLEISPHRGPYKGLLRVHLALIVPKNRDQCGLLVNNEAYHWTEVQCLIFDDTIEHSAWSRSEEERVVLFLDVGGRFAGLSHSLIN